MVRLPAKKYTAPRLPRAAFSPPQIEAAVLAFWRERRVFEKSVARRKKGKRFVFYEGPPTANGRPGIHHVLARAFKDIILRYKTMRGFYAPRRGGWDTHGLPVELEVEKKLKLSSKKEIEAYGVAEFNQKCRESVWAYKDEWERLTERMGFWLDMEHPYITYENNYIETLWWIIAQFWRKKLLYKGHKVVPWCTRCGTSLSSHELNQPEAYKKKEDTAVYVKFKLQPGQKLGDFITDQHTYILSWTTTPWTLPGNVALAVGPKIEYLLAAKDGEHLLLAKAPVSALGDGVKNVKMVSGKDLEGLAYEPLFEVPALRSPAAYRVYAADFVTTTDGTGVVHTAVMYGEDDYALGQQAGLPQRHTVDESGRFTAEVKELAGLPVKAKATEEKILAHLQARGMFFKQELYAHDYPHCWRCDTPLLYYARTSWFVKMSALRAKLLRNNARVHWVPAHLSAGRFGEWLKEAKDWNFSRARYWGTPLPIWECAQCDRPEVVESFADLKKKVAARNIYFFMRHGEADHSAKNLPGPSVDTPEYTSHLLPLGRAQTEKTAAALIAQRIDVIIASPLARTRETAEIVARATGAKIVYDERLIDLNPGIFLGKKITEYEAYFSNKLERFTKAPPNGETYAQVRTRVVAAFKDITARYLNRRILVISHAGPLRILRGALEGLTDEKTMALPGAKVGKLYPVRPSGLPLSAGGQVDAHRPFVDEVFLRCRQCGGNMERVKELADVWFDSGAMPLAQGHYPFEHATDIDRRRAFPADYIVEAMDQTRGWFYTLLAVATALGQGAPYTNAISLGLIHDKQGLKMSKSKGNMVDPWLMMQKYGSDAVRWYFYTVNPPGEPKNFDENEVSKAFRKMHLILYNSFLFYDTYANRRAPARIIGGRQLPALDRWILARLAETKRNVTVRLDAYDVREAALLLEGLVDDLSRWYIRRSRRRLQKPETRTDYARASAVLGHVLAEVSKLTAPFTPFLSEALYASMPGSRRRMSAHWEDWPAARQIGAVEKKLLTQMSEVRRLASMALAKRAEAGVKVRQPLSKLKVKSKKLKITDTELLGILSEEVNVKQVEVRAVLKAEVELDTQLTPELRAEGILRDVVRLVQELRQQAGCAPPERITLYIHTAPELKTMLLRQSETLQKEVGATAVRFEKSAACVAEAEEKINGAMLWLGVKNEQPVAGKRQLDPGRL